MKFFDKDTGSIYKVMEKNGWYKAARLRPDAKKLGVRVVEAHTVAVCESSRRR